MWFPSTQTNQDDNWKVQKNMTCLYNLHIAISKKMKKIKISDMIQ